MKITFLGAAHEVTGSCTLIETCGHKFLIDCGMEQGKDIFVNQKLPVNPNDVDLVILTHAHIDHCGNLPLLAKNGFDNSIYATEATCSLCDIMLRDSAHIQMFEAEWKNRKAKRAGKEEYVALYDMQDAEKVLSNLRPCKYGEMIRVLENVEIRFTDVGHLLGSAAVEIMVTENGKTEKIVFSGDIGNVNRPIVNDPKSVESADYVVIESTYGNRLHEDAEDNILYLADVIKRTFERGGNVVIPSFAVGRTQEILYYIRRIKDEKLLGNIGYFETYVDSPLAEEATKIYIQAPTDFVDREAADLIRQGINPFWFDGLVCSKSSEESKAINENKNPKIIISASGMCEAGRIRHHLKHNIWNEKSTILFVGYQAAGTLGRYIFDGAEKVKIFGEEFAVKAEICYLPGVSGHADRNGLANWIDAIAVKPKRVFVNHGDDDSANDFTKFLCDKGYNAMAPFSGTVFDTLKNDFEIITKGIFISNENAVRKENSKPYSELVSSVNELLNCTKQMKGRSNREIEQINNQILSLIAKIKG